MAQTQSISQSILRPEVFMPFSVPKGWVLEAPGKEVSSIDELEPDGVFWLKSSSQVEANTFLVQVMSFASFRN